MSVLFWWYLPLVRVHCAGLPCDGLAGRHETREALLRGVDDLDGDWHGLQGDPCSNCRSMGAECRCCGSTLDGAAIDGCKDDALWLSMRNQPYLEDDQHLITVPVGNHYHSQPSPEHPRRRTWSGLARPGFLDGKANAKAKANASRGRLGALPAKDEKRSCKGLDGSQTTAPPILESLD